MFKIPEPVLILFVVSSAAGFLFRFFKDATYKNLSLKPLLSRLPLFLLVFLPYALLLFIAQQFSVSQAANLAYFAGAAVLSFLFSSIGLPSYLRGILLLAASVALTIFAPADFISLAAVLSGLLSYKLTENLAFNQNDESSLDDLLPPLCWLSSIMWLSTIDDAKTLPARAAVILGVISVSLLLKLMQGPFVRVANPGDDKILLKRLVLSITGGLAVLIVIVKLLNLMQYQMLAVLAGFGYLISYLYKDLSGEDRYSLPGQPALRLLIFIGLATLVAMRFYGTYGLLVLAPTAMVAPLSTAALFPGLYLATRALLQVYLQHFNMNVTGINLTHAYAGAAQYAGFMLGIAMLLLLHEKMDRRVLLALTLSTCIITPVLSNFILHAEPSCSLFSSAIVSCFLLSVAGPALQQLKTKGAENIALAPALMICSGIVTSGLLSLGTQATIAVKSTVLSYGLLFLIFVSFLFWFIYQRKNSGPKSGVSNETPA